MTDEEFTKKLNAQCDKFKDKPFDLNGKYTVLSHNQAVQQFMPNSRFYDKYKLNVKFDFAVIYGHNPKLNNATLKAALVHNIPVILAEDGFIRGYDTWANKRQLKKYTEQCSLIIDRIGFHYDASRLTDLEQLLQTHEVTSCEIEKAKYLIDEILRRKITKYNHQPNATKKYGRPDNKKVLVVDQSYNDWSIKISGGNEKSFELMLRKAIEDNPGCDILVKVHPDTLARKKIIDKRFPLGYYENIKQEGNVFLVADGVNPYSLLEQVDDVYVYSTQLGFEALLAGKKVHTFGTPFYAGWGLTDDYREFPNRKRKLTVEEMFYIVYCVYTKWYSPSEKKACSIEKALEYIDFIKKDYVENMVNNHSITWCVDTDLNNNVMALQSIFSFMENTSTTEDFYVITCRDNPFIHYYAKIAKLKIVFADDFMEKFSDGEGRLSKFAYARLMLFDKKSVFAKYKFNLYVDNDTIAVRNLDKNLFGIGNAMTRAVGMVKEFSEGNKAFSNYKEFCADNKLKCDCSHYGNTGVLLVNNSQIKDDDLDNCIRLQELKFPLCDQGLLNYYFQGRIQDLKGKYNSYDFTDKEKNQIAIKHYPNNGRKVECADLFSQNYAKYVFWKFLK